MDTPTPDNQPIPSPPAETADSARPDKKHHELKLEAPHHPAKAESAPAAPASAPIIGSPPIPGSAQPPPPPSLKQAVDAATVSTSANPELADDVDVIEKEWVDRAEEVIKDTAGDPHAEEEGFEDLQVDYQKKRYGIDIKPAEDE